MSTLYFINIQYTATKCDLGKCLSSSWLEDNFEVLPLSKKLTRCFEIFERNDFVFKRRRINLRQKVNRFGEVLPSSAHGADDILLSGHNIFEIKLHISIRKPKQEKRAPHRGVAKHFFKSFFRTRRFNDNVKLV